MASIIFKQLKNTIYFYTRINNLYKITKSFKFYIYNNLITYLPNHLIRILFLRYFLKVKIGKMVFVHMGCRFEGKIQIGDNSVIGRRCILIGNIKIGKNVSITAECYLFSMSHYVNDPYFKTFDKEILIDDYCWLGARAIVYPGVKMEEGSVLGANSVATKKIDSYEIHVGSPAKKINNRNAELKYNLNYSPFFQ
jgi:maltose O-acetyltransferase